MVIGEACYYYCSNILFSQFSWPRDSERPFWSSCHLSTTHVGGFTLSLIMLNRGGVEDTRLEATDTKKIRGHGHKRKCSPKKKKRSSQKFFKQSPQKNVFQKILTIQKIKIVLSSSRGQANFRGLEAKAKDFKMCPRGLHL